MYFLQNPDLCSFGQDISVQEGHMTLMCKAQITVRHFQLISSTVSLQKLFIFSMPVSSYVQVINITFFIKWIMHVKCFRTCLGHVLPKFWLSTVILAVDKIEALLIVLSPKLQTYTHMHLFSHCSSLIWRRTSFCQMPVCPLSSRLPLPLLFSKSPFLWESKAHCTLLHSTESLSINMWARLLSSILKWARHTLYIL